MPKPEQLAHLIAQEVAAKAALDEQRKVLKAVQAKRQAEERRMRLDRWREIGRLVDEAGLGQLGLEVLAVAFAHLATLAHDPAQVTHWRQQLAGPTEASSTASPGALLDGSDTARTCGS
jgi:hypothetical protein